MPTFAVETRPIGLDPALGRSSSASAALIRPRAAAGIVSLAQPGKHERRACRTWPARARGSRRSPSPGFACARPPARARNRCVRSSATSSSQLASAPARRRNAASGGAAAELRQQVKQQKAADRRGLDDLAFAGEALDEAAGPAGAQEPAPSPRRQRVGDLLRARMKELGDLENLAGLDLHFLAHPREAARRGS